MGNKVIPNVPSAMDHHLHLQQTFVNSSSSENRILRPIGINGDKDTSNAVDESDEKKEKEEGADQQNEDKENSVELKKVCKLLNKFMIDHHQTTTGGATNSASTKTDDTEKSEQEEYLLSSESSSQPCISTSSSSSSRPKSSASSELNNDMDSGAFSGERCAPSSSSTSGSESNKDSSSSKKSKIQITELSKQKKIFKKNIEEKDGAGEEENNLTDLDQSSDMSLSSSEVESMKLLEEKPKKDKSSGKPTKTSATTSGSENEDKEKRAKGTKQCQRNLLQRKKKSKGKSSDKAEKATTSSTTSTTEETTTTAVTTTVETTETATTTTTTTEPTPELTSAQLTTTAPSSLFTNSSISYNNNNSKFTSDFVTPSRLEYLLDLPETDHATQVAHAWNPDDRSLNIFVKESDPLTLHRHPVAQSTDCIRTKMVYTRGIHLWELSWNSRQRGTHAIIGVSTEKTALHCVGYQSLIGSTAESWGWDLGRNRACHNTKASSQPPPIYPKMLKPDETFVTPDCFSMCLDMDEGTLSYMADGQFLGVAFRGLRGKKVSPIVSAVWGHAEITMKYVNGMDPNPLPLVDLARRCVRQSVGKPGLDEKIISISGLPNVIKNFLIYRQNHQQPEIKEEKENNEKEEKEDIKPTPKEEQKV